jgi:hypothetical protein
MFYGYLAPKPSSEAIYIYICLRTHNKLLRCLPFRHLNHERRFVPKSKYLLLIPELALYTQFHIKIPQHPPENKSHLCIRDVPHLIQQQYLYSPAGNLIIPASSPESCHS